LSLGQAVSGAPRQQCISGCLPPALVRELTAGTPLTAQYIDGGIMDNLPMDAIARFLDRAGRLRMIERFPDTPHLIVGASLEVVAPTYSTAFQRRRLKRSWLALSRRARQLSYNTKLDTYEFAESAMRNIHAHVLKHYPACKHSRRTAELIGIHVLPTKPNWLCGTFAFHPMLGFRREKQARSIAHGCATTLLQFAHYLRDEESGLQHLKDWGIEEPDSVLPAYQRWSALFEKAKQRRQAHRTGDCCLRDCPCPFSRQSLSDPALGLSEAEIAAVSEIHAHCPEPESHLRKI
jgi:hypothetical protein